MTAGEPPTPAHRVVACVALVAAAVAVGYLVYEESRRWEVLLASAASLAVALVAAWWVLSRRGAARVAAAVVVLLALAAFVTVMLASDSLRVLVVVALLTALAVGLGEWVLRAEQPTPHAPRAPAPCRPVLLMNPRSGGGKAGKFRLEEQCRSLDIEPVVLREGDDLEALAEDAVARGADVLGMAGGDGSQALVASVASRHGIPFVVVPAGTRNHLALDLRLDRDDVVGALAAYRHGVDLVVDLAEVNGRVFVNNASMGAYAKVVGSDDYRDAKIRTALTKLPEVLGPDATPPDLRFPLADGSVVTTAHVLLVSNNQYQFAHFRGGGTRERLDGGVLGVVCVVVGGEDAATSARDTRSATPTGWTAWTVPDLVVESDAPVEIGVDGEALTLEPPLSFRIRPGALVVRVPAASLRRTVGVQVLSPAAVGDLWRTATGRPPRRTRSLPGRPR